ncbi:MAG: hypothetical protein H7Y12_07510 [Sphingobacteriaceae bacterium]|nr:hypothetical protein [Cytophagaceae bacterium]
MKAELKPSPERRLLSHLETLRLEQVAAAGKSIPLRRVYVQMQAAMTMEGALAAPKLMNLRGSLGDEMVRKLLCFVVASATASHLSASPLDVLEVATLLAEQYPTESVKDVVLAFKRAKLKGQAPAGLPLAALVFQLMGAHLEEKSRFLEQRHRESLDWEATDELGVLRAINQSRVDLNETEDTPPAHRIGRRYRKAG